MNDRNSVSQPLTFTLGDLIAKKLRGGLLVVAAEM